MFQIIELKKWIGHECTKFDTSEPLLFPPSPPLFPSFPLFCPFSFPSLPFLSLYEITAFVSACEELKFNLLLLYKILEIIYSTWMYLCTYAVSEICFSHNHSRISSSIFSLLRVLLANPALTSKLMVHRAYFHG